MFLRVVDTVVTQVKEVTKDIDNEESARIGFSDIDQQELFDVHGKPLQGKSD
jgi:hypothetical protein